MRIGTRFRALFLGFLFLAAPTIAAATTIDFDNGLPRSWDSGSTYFEDGYALLFESPVPPGFFFQGAGAHCMPPCADNGTFNMMSWGGSLLQTMTLTRVDGGTFSLLSFDGAESFTNFEQFWATAIRANGVDFLLDQVNDGTAGIFEDFQTFSPTGLIDVNAVVFSGVASLTNGREFKIDNLVVEVTTVPDHGDTWSLLVLGIGLTGLALAKGWS